MKHGIWILSAVFLASAGASSAAPIGNPPPPRRFELAKCTAPKHGTLWASFGHLMTSDSEAITYFPTELAVFAPDLTSRLVYPTLDEALKVDLQVGSGRVHLAFRVPHGSSTRSHLLQLMQYDPRIDNAYIGNWIVTENGAESYDQVSCSLD